MAEPSCIDDFLLIIVRLGIFREILGIGDQLGGEYPAHDGRRRGKGSKLTISLLVSQDKNPLSDQIDDLLVPEILRGANQYHCSHCDAKCDASRAMQLKRLPPILHFSMMRFVYDVKSGTRKKSKAAIRFPPRIDMGEYLSGEREDEEDMFELRGVVEHRGASVSGRNSRLKDSEI